MSRPTIEEQIKALATLREFALNSSRDSLNTLSRSAAEAVLTLDDGDVFADLDQERNDREAAAAPRTPVAILRLRPTLFQAHGADGQVWATATTYKGVEEHLLEQSTLFLVVSPDELPQYAPEQVGLPTLAPGEEIRPAFSDTHPRAARELGEMIAANEKHRDTYTVHPPEES